MLECYYGGGLQGHATERREWRATRRQSREKSIASGEERPGYGEHGVKMSAGRERVTMA